MVRRFAAGMVATLLFGITLALAAPAAAQAHGPGNRPAHSSSHVHGMQWVLGRSAAHRTHPQRQPIRVTTPVTQRPTHANMPANTHTHDQHNSMVPLTGTDDSPLPGLIKGIEDTVGTIVKGVGRTVRGVTQPILGPPSTSTTPPSTPAPTNPAPAPSTSSTPTTPAHHPTHTVSVTRTPTQPVHSSSTGPAVAVIQPAARGGGSRPAAHQPKPQQRSKHPTPPTKATSPPKARALNLPALGPLHSTTILLILGGVALATLVAMGYLLRVGRRGATT
jgi:hypothetical protein